MDEEDYMARAVKGPQVATDTEDKDKNQYKGDIASANNESEEVAKPPQKERKCEALSPKRKYRKRPREPMHHFLVQPRVVQFIRKPKSFVDHSYSDFSKVPRELGYHAPSTIKKKTFSQKVHAMLSQDIHSHAIAWMPHGRAFRILAPKLLEREVLPMYFTNSPYSKFLSQLRSWGFKELTTGKDRGCYYHECFLRGLPHLCQYMPIHRLEPRRKKQDPANEPDFYEISKLYPLLGDQPAAQEIAPKPSDEPAQRAIQQSIAKTPLRPQAPQLSTTVQSVFASPLSMGVSANRRLIHDVLKANFGAGLDAQRRAYDLLPAPSPLISISTTGYGPRYVTNFAHGTNQANMQWDSSGVDLGRLYPASAHYAGVVHTDALAQGDTKPAATLLPERHLFSSPTHPQCSTPTEMLRRKSSRAGPTTNREETLQERFYQMNRAPTLAMHQAFRSAVPTLGTSTQVAMNRAAISASSLQSATYRTQNPIIGSSELLEQTTRQRLATFVPNVQGNSIPYQAQNFASLQIPHLGPDPFEVATRLRRPPYGTGRKEDNDDASQRE